MAAMDLTEAQLGYIMRPALLPGLVLGWPAVNTALVLIVNASCSAGFTGICECCLTGATMAADSKEVAAHVPRACRSRGRAGERH